VTGTAGTAITVAPGAGVVVLRGLQIKGVGADNGIAATGPGVILHIESCVISGFRLNNVLFSDGDLYVKDSVLRDGLGHGLACGTANVSVTRSLFENNTGDGLTCGNATRVSVQDSTSSGNGHHGFNTNIGEMSLRRVKAFGNGIRVSNGVASAGISCSSAGGTMRVADALVTNNAVGFKQVGTCAFKSLGNNVVDGNTTNRSGTFTSLGGI
jgi:hypothetical protein